jgi:hypothetical protein
LNRLYFSADQKLIVESLSFKTALGSTQAVLKPNCLQNLAIYKPKDKKIDRTNLQKKLK